MPITFFTEPGVSALASADGNFYIETKTNENEICARKVVTNFFELSLSCSNLKCFLMKPVNWETSKENSFIIIFFFGILSSHYESLKVE